MSPQRYPNANYPLAYDEANMGKADAVAINEQQLEQQSVASDGTGGTFTLTFEGQETGTIAFDAAASDIKTALELLSTITLVNVTGGDLPTDVLVEFVTPGPSNVPLMVADDTLLTGETLGTVIVQVQPGSVAVTDAVGAQVPL